MAGDKPGHDENHRPGQGLSSHDTNEANTIPACEFSMFFILSKIFAYFIAPSHFVIFATSLGIALCFTRFARAGRRLASFGAVALLALACSPLGNFLALPLENRFPAQPHDMAPPDGVIVLGGAVDESLSGQRSGGVRFNNAAERLTAAVDLARRFPRARLVFTGGTAALLGSPFTEAEVVKRFWRDMGVDRDDVIYEDRSRNTYENAVFTRELVKPKPNERWLLVTSAIHIPRAVGVFREADFPVIPYPVDFRTSGLWTDWSLPHHAPAALELVDSAAHEWTGLVAYRLTGKSDAFFPAP
jgi:uncharacterized SAM-binding protein YcdF (DUF218 family)